MTAYHILPGASLPQRCEDPATCVDRVPEECHYKNREEAFAALPLLAEAEPEVEVAPLPEGFIVGTTASFSPGHYWLGDPSYVGAQDGKLWDEWVRIAGDSSEGFTDPLAGALYLGFPLVGADTLYGDGLFTGTDGLSYPVDGGMIGPVPLELIEALELDRDRLHALGSWVEISEPTLLTREDDGTITFGTISIATGETE